MPYEIKDELPENVKNVLPNQAQKIYLKAFNSAWHQYAQAQDRRGDTDREEVSHRVAWSAVKQKYEKAKNGEWIPKDM